jgi:hypothetical protein
MMMVAVAISGLILGSLSWLAGWVVRFLDFYQTRSSPGFSAVITEVSIEPGPYSLSSSSPEFWPIFCSGLVGLAVVLVPQLGNGVSGNREIV